MHNFIFIVSLFGGKNPGMKIYFRLQPATATLFVSPPERGEERRVGEEWRGRVRKKSGVRPLWNTWGYGG
jgi:hypothetical protein